MSTFNNIQTSIQHQNIVFTVINQAPPTSERQEIISNLAVPSITQTNQQPIEEKISAGMKGRRKGYAHSKKTKAKISASMQGKGKGRI